MAELADALDSKSSGRKVVGVRFPPLVLKETFVLNRICDACRKSYFRLNSQTYGRLNERQNRSRLQVTKNDNDSPWLIRVLLNWFVNKLNAVGRD